VGYFSNGTEGESYHAQYCARCVHDDSCSIWLLHMMHNYDECNKPQSFLHVLIPRSKDQLGNEQCSMFIARPEPPPTSRTMTHCDHCGMPYHGGACSHLPQTSTQSEGDRER